MGLVGKRQRGIADTLQVGQGILERIDIAHDTSGDSRLKQTAPHQEGTVAGQEENDLEGNIALNDGCMFLPPALLTRLSLLEGSTNHPSEETKERDVVKDGGLGRVPGGLQVDVAVDRREGGLGVEVVLPGLAG